MGGEFLGTGWKFPVRLTTAGEIALVREEEDIREAIRIILGTAPGERLMHPDFGCGIHDYVFAPNTVRTAGLIRYSVEQALNRWEPRIELEGVEAGPDPGDPAVILVVIRYRVKSTDSRFNLVYPFYLTRGEEP
jgi:hypothetical protein